MWSYAVVTVNTGVIAVIYDIVFLYVAIVVGIVGCVRDVVIVAVAVVAVMCSVHDVVLGW